MPEPTLTPLKAPRSAGRNGRPTMAPEPIAGDGGPPQSRPKLKKLRVALILLGLSLLALISTVFGMMMAVASDLPALENQAEYQAARNSVLLDAKDGQLARLTGNNNRILIDETDVSPTLKNAVIAVEDERFYDHEGVDYFGIGRALVQDIRRQSAVQGGSTITQQFVKNALAAQGDRSVFQKLRESALAYHLERQWTKQKILTQYLNTVYFGNGAYGVESAMRTYFNEGGDDLSSSDRLAENVEPAQAALLAGMIATPSGYDPVQNPTDARDRRNLVLEKMRDQGMITPAEYEAGINEPIPTESEIEPPELESKQPYFSTWVTQQLVDRYGAGRVFAGGLKITTTLDPSLQAAAERAVSRISGVGPTSSLVAIENDTGEVKAMVGGENYDKEPFNLATNGHRQPGSTIKPFTLVTALEQGISPDMTYESRRKVLPYPGRPNSNFVATNYEGSYSGTATLRDATIKSDNSVYAEVGLEVGTKKIAANAEQMGIRTPISTNPAMTLGGLKEGFTPLEMAFAYSSIANGGERQSGTLASYPSGPVAIKKVQYEDDEVDVNKSRSERALPADAANEAREILTGVVTSGTGTKAQIPGQEVWGKTGTTENYGDAWFVGGNDEYTVAVWVGYADRVKPMTTEYNGEGVAGGTYPAEIWHAFMTAAVSDDDIKSGDDPGALPVTPTTPAPTEPAPEAPAAPAAPAAPPPTAPAPAAPPESSQPAQPQPEPSTPAPAPAPETGQDQGVAPGAEGQ